MIGDQDGIRAGIHRHLRVFDIENALDDQLARPQRSHPFEGLHVERAVELAFDQLRHFLDVAALHLVGVIAEAPALGVKHRECPVRVADDAPDVRGCEFGWHAEPVMNIAIASALDVQVHGQDEHRAARLLRAFQQVPREAAVLLEIELEPEGPVDRGADVLDRQQGVGRQGKRDAEIVSRAARQDFAVRPDRTAHAGWADGDRHADLFAEHGGLELSVGHVEHDPLAEADGVEVAAVLAQRDLREGAGLRDSP